jgi:O-antigen ligase
LPSPFKSVRWSVSYVGFLLYIFAIITYKAPIGAAAMAIALAGVFLERGKIRLPPFLAWFALLVIWGALGLTSSIDTRTTQNAVIALGKVWLIAFAACNALRTPQQLRFFRFAILGFFVIAPLRATFVNYATGYRMFGRAVGPAIFANPNYLAAFCLLMLGIALGTAAAERRGSIYHVGSLVASVLLVIGIVLTQSRGAFLGLLVMVLPYLIVEIRRRPSVAFGIVAVGALLFVATPQSVWTRVSALRSVRSAETLREADEEGSASQRLDILLTALRIVRDSPVRGVGLGTYQTANARYSPAIGSMDAHNSYTTFAAETGIPGLVFFLMAIGTVLVRSIRTRRRAWKKLPNDALLLRSLEFALLGFLFDGLFTTFGHLPFLYIHLVLLWTSVTVVERALTPARKNPARPLGSGGLRR